MTRPADDHRGVLLTASGTGADMWTGYPAELARRCEDLCYWQPINYKAAAFPMGTSVDEGVNEGVRLVLEFEDSGNPPPFYIVSGYSQGGMVVSLLLDEFRTGRLKHLRHKLIAGATFGNPHRELDAKGGRGISNRRIVNTPEWWVDEFDPADIYANVPNDVVGEDMTAIFRAVQLRSLLDLLTGADSLVEQVTQLMASPLREFPAMILAIVKALVFFGQKPATAPHTEYHLREVSPGVTYFEHAVAHVRRRAEYALAA